MMDIKKNFRLLFLGPFTFFVLLQPVQSQSITTLGKGEPLPEIKLDHVWKGNGTSVSDLRGKVIILDFWNTACSACISGFPKLNELQKKFESKIKILLVTSDSREKVEQLFKRITPKVSNLTIITNDSVFTKLFPHRSEPHQIWIDKEGKFQYQTFSFNATEQNIDAFIQGQQLDITEKEFSLERSNEEPDLPVLIQGNLEGVSSEYSILTKGLFKYTASNLVRLKIDSATGYPSELKIIGHSPLSLLICAFSKDVNGYDVSFANSNSLKRVVLEVKDSMALFLPREDQLVDKWKRQNELSYEVKMIPNSPNDLYRRMQSDLSQSLKISGKVENRYRSYLALVKLRNRSSEETSKIGLSRITVEGGMLKFFNTPVRDLIKKIDDGNYITKLPVIDCTGENSVITLSIKAAHFYNLSDLRSNLRRVGFDIEERNGPIPMLVITDM